MSALLVNVTDEICSVKTSVPEVQEDEIIPDRIYA